MRRKWLCYSLFILTAGFLLCFVLTLLPALQHEWRLMPVMLLLAISLVVLHGYGMLTTAPASLKQTTLPTLTAQEAPVMLIAGPWAAKWFRQHASGDDSRFNQQQIWLLVHDAKTLDQRLERIRLVSPNAQAVVFFPLLPDAEDTAAQIKTKISQWEQQFASVIAHHTPPAVLAVYARLSRAASESQPFTEKWLNDVAIDTRLALSTEEALHQLDARIDSATASSPQEVQRAVISKQLLLWLTESGIADSLARIFSPDALRLNQLMMCDCSAGFHRHGAWSSWLAQRYALLPGLSTSTAEPPLPLVKLKPQSGQKPCRPAAISNTPGLLWSQLLVTLILAASLLITTVSIHQQQQDFHQRMQPQLSPLDDLSAVKLQGRITRMQALYNSWLPCSEIPALRTWGLSPCAGFLDTINQRMAILTTLPSYSTLHGRDQLFNSGSATLVPQAIPQLEAIADLIRAHPQRKVVITGHADNTGSKRVNDVISAQRAKAVAQWLTQHGIDPSLLITRTAGAEEPVATNDNAQGRQENRRVDVIILPSAEMTKEFTSL